MQRKEDGYFSSELLPLKPERGFLLTTWLIFFVFINGYFIYVHARQGSWLPLIWAVFGVICGVGTWFWFKLAFYGMLLGYAYNVMQNLDAQSVGGIVFSLVFMGLTYFLVRQKWEFYK